MPSGSGPELAPTALTALPEADGELPAEATRSLAQPPTAILAMGGESALSEANTAQDAAVSATRTEPPPPRLGAGAPPDFVVPMPRGPGPAIFVDAPVGASASDLAAPPRALVTAERSASQMRRIERAATVIIGMSIALGVAVILMHLAGSGRAPEPGPVRVVAHEVGAVAAHATSRTVPPAEIGPDVGIDRMERIAADHLASGRLREAASVYAALARRAPHERAYATAARVLSTSTTIEDASE